MRWLSCCAVLTLAMVAAGCASTPSANVGAAVAPLSPAAGAAGGQQTAAVNPEVVPDLVVEAIDPMPGSAVRCREMLKPGSNVIVNVCLTLNDWKRFEARQAEAGRAMLRALRGESTY